jgi:hypothetical protein
VSLPAQLPRRRAWFARTNLEVWPVHQSRKEPHHGCQEDIVGRDIDEQDSAGICGMCEVTGGSDINGTGTARIGVTFVRETVGST